MLKDIEELYFSCFPEDESVAELLFPKIFSEENCRFEKVDGRVVSELFIVEKRLSYYGNDSVFPFICGVCTDERYRKRGLASQLMERTLFELAEKYPFAMLSSSVGKFYERFGFVGVCKTAVPQMCYLGDGVNPETMKRLYDENSAKFPIRQIKTQDEFAFRAILAQKQGREICAILGENRSIIGFSDDEFEVCAPICEGKEYSHYLRILNLQRLAEVIQNDITVELKDNLIEDNSVVFRVFEGEAILSVRGRRLSAAQYAKRLFDGMFFYDRF